MSPNADSPPTNGDTIACAICGRQVARHDAMPVDMIRPAIRDTIAKNIPGWTPHGAVCVPDLNRYSREWIGGLLEEERGDLSELEESVVRSLREQETLAQDLNIEFGKKLTLGDRVADKVAEFGGSWTFIIGFGCVMAAWIALNTTALLAKPFDPFPYILLNLVLSCLAAVQAPIIMMSQNRQEAKDRLRAEHDYKINLKAELEIRHLNAKLDLLLTRHWHRLLEIQQVQTDLIEEVLERAGGPGRSQAAES